MRFLKIVMIVASSLMLAGCVSSLIVGNQLQSKLMWAFMEPLVGFNPNEINFFEAPLIKNRMTALLGDKYEPTMKLLRTANEIQQEGALYYVVSRYAPTEVKDVVDTAGMVWNADTNQIAVMLVQDGVPDIVSEQVAAGKQALVPVLPAQLRTVYDQAVAVKTGVDAKTQQLDNLQDLLGNPEDPILELIKQKEREALEKTGN
jgi:hypothetical protein